jgi:diguanylate cyclase (GGDEF)-like protein
MLWNKRKTPEPFQIESPSPEVSGVRVADPDRALDTLGALLKIYGRLGFDVEGRAVSALREQCEAWAQRIVLGETRRQSGAGAASTTFVRDWPGLLRFFDEQRRQEGEYVKGSLGSLRQTVLAFARCLSSSVGEDQESDARVDRELDGLSRALVKGDSQRLADAASLVIQTARESMAQRRKREAAQGVALGEQLRQLREESSEAREAIAVDELTGLFNRAAFDQQLEQLSGIGMLLGERPWLILVEVDGFDAIVARHGQALADDVLRQVSHAVSRTFLRRQDFVGRYAGEKLGALLVDITQAQLLSAIERLLLAVRALEIKPARTRALPVTVSIGLARMRANEPTARWLSRASVALQRAKEDGRDRYELSPG